MNEAHDAAVPSITDDVLDIVELGNAVQETRQFAPTQIVLDNLMQWGYGG